MYPNDPNPTTPGPDGLPPAAPRKRHHYIRWTLAGFGALILLIVIIGVAAGGTKNTGTTTAPQQSTSAPATQAAAPAATTAAPSPSNTLTGPAGTTFTVTGTFGTSDTPGSYTVTLDQVSQQVSAGAYMTPQHAGDHFAAVQFTITGVSGSVADDANSDANAIGSDQQEYSPTFLVNTLPNFSSGEFNVSPGQSVKGWVAFELPSGVTVASVQWAPSFNGSAGTWTVGS